MARRLKGFKSLWLIAAVAAALTIAGCSDNSPLSPDDNLELGKRGFQTVKYQEVETSTLSASQIVTKDDGGVVEIEHGDYDHEFVVAKDAVDYDVEISAAVEKVIINGRVAVVFEFGPSGLVFNSPAKLVFDSDEIYSRDNEYKFYYFDPSVEAWVIQSAKNADRGGKVEFDVSHFSKYAISD